MANKKAVVKGPKDFSDNKRRQLRRTSLNALTTVKVVDRNEISDEQLNQIAIILSVKPWMQKGIIDHFVNIGIPESEADIILSKILKFKNVDRVNEYFSNRTITIDDFMNEKFSVVKALRKMGFNPEFSKWFMSYAWKCTPAIGGAEIALAAILKGASRPESKEAGDLKVSSEPTIIEVKCKGARLKGQKGFGDQTSVKKAWIDGYKALMIDKNITVNVPENIMGEDDLVYNFTSGNWAHETISIDLMKASKRVSKKDIAKVVASGLKVKFQNINEEETADWIKIFINNNGSWDQRGFLRHFSVVAFNYYADTEKFKKMILYNNDTEQLFAFKVEDFTKYLDDKFVVTPGGYGKDGGPQGPYHAITLK